MAISMRACLFIIGASTLGNIPLHSSQCGGQELPTIEERINWLMCTAQEKGDLDGYTKALEALHTQILATVPPAEQEAVRKIFELEVTALRASANYSGK